MIDQRFQPLVRDVQHVDAARVAEQWRPVVGFAQYYEVSSLGRIRSLMASGGRRRRTPRILRPSSDIRGYPKVTIAWCGRKVSKMVHSLVAEAFLGPRPPGYDVNHKDSNRANAAASNLEYVTRGENLRHSYRSGFATRAGEANSCAKLKPRNIRSIISMATSGFSQRAIATAYGINQATVSDIVTGRTWSHVTGRKYVRAHD